MRFISTTTIAVLTAICVNLGAMAADWQPIGQPVSQSAEKIEIDRSRIGYGGNGLVSVWSRLNMPQTISDAGSRYNMVEALNRYDCAGNQFATLKRLYLLDNALVGAESVLAPKEINVASGSVDAAILVEVCKISRGETKDGLMNADMRQPTAAEPLRFLTVADAGPAQSAAAKSAETTGAMSPTAATPSAGLRRFIALPRIDPSQIQHPTDEPKPIEAAVNADPVAVKREAAKAGVSIEPALNGLDRHAREVALATSGLRHKKAASHRGQPRDDPPAVLQHKDIAWSYEDEGAPAHWGKLRADYAQCEDGPRQSPIDIHDGIRVDLEPIKFDYRLSQFRIVDNGHTVQVNPGEGNTITVMGRTWRLVQLHFHRPSEERIDGRGFDMVMHLVHKDDEGHLAVVAVLIERGAEHPVIQTFWNNLPLETDVELAPAAAIDPNKLLPETRTYYTYMGSLTTPPCSEGVLWMVLKQPLQLSAEQIAIFSRLYKNNARPVQASNGRLIKESR